jgi:hypothetical protein
MAVVWKQHALQSRSAKNETLVAKAPAQVRATPGLARSEHRADPGEPVSAPLRGPSSELPASTTSTALTDREARTPGTPAPSSVAMEQAPKEAAARAAPSKPSRTDLPEGQPVPQGPGRQPPPRTELANVVSPEVDAKQPAPAGTVDQKSSGETPRRHSDRKAEAVGSIHKKPKKHPNVATVAATPRPNNLQGSEGEPRLGSSGATALRWPSADEPFVNLGMRKR